VKGEGRRIAGEEKAYPEVAYERELMEVNQDHKQIIMAGKVTKTCITERSKISVKWAFNTNKTLKTTDRLGAIYTNRQILSVN
jgi:hypothetical protein